MVRLLWLPCLIACAFATLPVRADKGDVEGAHDYPGWTRLPGFEITDYDEDNPSEFTFAVSRPLPIDANHLEALPVVGHRYIIRYEWNDKSQPPSLAKSEKYYEKLAAAGGYIVEKSGAVGNVTETFHLKKGSQQTWVYLNPSVRVIILTIVESRSATPSMSTEPTAPSTPSAPETLSVVTPPPAAPAPAPAPTPPVAVSSVTVGPAPAPTPPVAVSSITVGPAAAPTPPPTPASPPGPSLTSPTIDPMIAALNETGRAVLPLNFLPGKPDMDVESKPTVDHVAAYLKMHPDLSVSIEGHTDLTGDEQANLKLSKDRALAVRSLLIADHISKKRLTAVGLGGTQPVADEGTAEGRQKNRRIELIVKKDSSPTSPAQPKAAPQKDVTMEETSPPIEPPAASTEVFHATAPDGVNYYPNPSGASASSTSRGAKSH